MIFTMPTLSSLILFVYPPVLIAVVGPPGALREIQ